MLESTEGETSQDTETNRASKGHSPTGECRGRDKSGHRYKPSKQGGLTNWRSQRERQVRTQKQTEQARGTHHLEIAKGGTSDDTEANQASEGHSLPRESRTRNRLGHRNNRVSEGNSLPRERRRGMSGHGNKPSERGALTSWRAQEGQVKTRKQTEKTRGTHELESAGRGTSKDTETNQMSKGHSRTGGHRGRDKSGLDN